MSDASVVIVAYGDQRIDVSAFDNCEIIVVDNGSSSLSELPSTAIVVSGHGNVGFGAGCNLGAARATSNRLILVNPDVQLLPDHVAWLAGQPADVVATVPLVDDRSSWFPTVSQYPSQLSLLSTYLRLGRLAAPGSRFRKIAERLTGPATIQRNLAELPNPTTFATHWVSGAVLSIDRELFASVGGFNEQYFLYFEDVDFGRRIYSRAPATRILRYTGPSGTHHVGGTQGPADRRRVLGHIRQSINLYRKLWR